MSEAAGRAIDELCGRTLDHVVSPVRVWTPEDGVTFVNRAWLDLTGTSLQDNTGDRWLRQVHDADRAALLVALATADRGGRFDYRVRTRDGGAVRVSDRPSAWTDDTTQRLIGIVHTLTSAHDTASVANAQGDQTPTMSKWAHELRGPLNAILGWSDLLASGESEPDVVQRGLKAIANNARQQALIIKRMTE